MSSVMEELYRVEFNKHFDDASSQGNSILSAGRKIQKVRQELRLEKHDLYTPKMVSLGPYHYANKELRKEDFKRGCLDWLSKNNVEKKFQLYSKVRERIGEIKSFYDDKSTDVSYKDENLALMILLDASFIINFMENSLRRLSNDTPDAFHLDIAEIEKNQIIPEEKENKIILEKEKKMKNNIDYWINHLGLVSSTIVATRDIMLLENQVPYFVLNDLMEIIYTDKAMRRNRVARFVNWITGADRYDAVSVIPGEVKKPPIHLLEACWRIFQMHGKEDDTIPVDLEFNPMTNTETLIYKNGGAMNLKAKGIHFVRTGEHEQSFRDIKFLTPRYVGKTKLHLPFRPITGDTAALLSNLIAYEVSPGIKREPVVMCYTSLMKSLIQTPEDVRELQGKGILVNRLANDEDVVQVFRGINTHDMTRVDTFRDVKLAINEHCEKISSTWLPVLMSTYFPNPWSAFIFLGAVIGIVTALMQTLKAYHV